VNAIGRRLKVVRPSLARGLVHAAGILVVLGMMAGTRAAAQATSCVTGVVSDQSHGVVTAVHVTLTNPKTGYSQGTNTNNAGVYEFLLVPPGSGYNLAFTKDNFETLAIGGVYLGVGVTETHDAQLKIGTITQRIEVTVSGEGTINTTDASIGNVIESRAIEDLPIQARLDVAGLLVLEPGVQRTGGDSQYGSVTGARADQQNITVDGLGVTDENFGFAFTAVGGAPVDSVEEMRVVVGNGDSKVSRSSAQVEIVTKAGTNDFHGALREYNRNTDFTANTFFNKVAGVPRGTLIRNQFGGEIGGPIRKNKLLFFFDYDGLRLTAPQQTIRSVPVDAVRRGGINYINSNPRCTSSARLNTQPDCVTTLSNTALSGQSVKGLDPAGTGSDAALISFFTSRYPKPNFASGGDGVNTEGFLFNAPGNSRSNTFVGRVDYALNSRQKLFGRGTWDRDTGDDILQQFPGDPENQLVFISHDRSFVVGHTWEITNTLANQINVGLTRSLEDNQRTFSPTFPNFFSFGTQALTLPYNNIPGQGRNVGVPQVREGLTWEKGRHTAEFGGDFRFIREYSYFNGSSTSPVIGLGGNLLSLNTTGAQPSLRPNGIYQTPTDLSAVQEWDGFFPVALGRYAATSASFNYNVAGTPLPIGTPGVRRWNQNEVELYAQDTWRVRSDLTLLLGLRWVYHGVPWERNGFESVANTTEQQLFGARVAAAASGTNGNGAAPLVSYVLAGLANKGATIGYYRPDYKDFGPKIGIAYSPAFAEGFLGKLFGDRKTSIRAGAGLSYDRVLNTFELELDTGNFLFNNNVPLNFGIAGDPITSLRTDPRFTSLASPPPISATPIPRPFTPNVDSSGNPIGLAVFGGFPNFFNFNQDMPTPYALTASFGIQRELPGNLLLDVSYFGRFGRRLLAIGDAAQQLNFKDSASGELLKTAFGNIQKTLQNNTPIGSIPAEPWFENQVGAALAANYGDSCSQFFGRLNCTNGVAEAVGNFVTIGDLSSTDLVLSQQGLLLPNTGLFAQTGSAGYIGNFSSSTYNSLLLVLRKRISHNLQFDIDYAYAHSIDNVSDISLDFQNFTFTGQGLICDLTNWRTCRGRSDFDARHTLTANYVYTLPIGHGQRFLGGASRWLDAMLSGWGTSGIVFWRSGFPLNTSTNTFPISFTQSAPAVFVGNQLDIASKVTVANGTVRYFASQQRALNAFAYPFGGGTGNRNSIEGPNYANVDMAIFKNFAMPWSQNQKLQFRADAFNVFNSVNWGNPSTAINNPGTFGVITTQANSPRVLQLALRYDF
jgi:hypothetical protein